MTNIGVCGANGKMGRVIYSIVSERKDCKIVAGIDINTDKYADFTIYSTPQEMIEKPDVIIDYSNPASLDNLIDYALSSGTALVLATTGYSAEQIEKIKKSAEQVPIFFTFNLSMGITLLVELAKKATAFLGEQFDIEIVEKHHNQKIDAPSGTAIMLANAINEARDNSCQFTYDRHSQRKKREKSEIGIHSIRGGTIVGEHEVIFAGRDEVITLSHQAASKQVFAVGSVNAALFMKSQKAGLYNMSNLI
ncbi:MAG: 4-hydroxy-tetrahydrodipicolinate reductase [Oscillospiraceae bacterium]